MQILTEKNMTTLSAVIITQNEERNISRCLNSLQGVADEVVVVDSGSTDATKEICLSHGTRFTHHDWQGYSGQKNYADTLATCEWIFSIDADEALSEPLRRSIIQLKAQGLKDGTVYRVNRLTNFCGQWIHHCGWYPDAKVRIWRKGAAHWEGTIHEQLKFTSPVRIVQLKGDLLHYSYYTLDELTSRQAKYYKLAAQEAFQKGKRCSGASLFFKPLWSFLRDYIFNGGFLDGTAGYTVCRMKAHYTFMKYATLQEMTTNAQPPTS